MLAVIITLNHPAAALMAKAVVRQIKGSFHKALAHIYELFEGKVNLAGAAAEFSHFPQGLEKFPNVA